MAYYSALENVSVLKIKEKVNLLEAASALLGQEIEMANKYMVKDQETGQDLFYAVEQTDCITRQLKQCFGDCAAWNLDIMYIGGGGAEQAMKMEKPWTCTVCCFNRPTVKVSDFNTGEVLGAVSDPCTCFGLTFTMKDADDSPLVTASGGCCQWGLCCPLPCGPCAEINFDLQDANSGNNVGLLKKKVPGCLKFFLAPDVDNYTVRFDSDGPWDGKNKALMMAMAIFMDFRIFSDNPSDDDDGKGGDVSAGE